MNLIKRSTTGEITHNELCVGDVLDIGEDTTTNKGITHKEPGVGDTLDTGEDTTEEITHKELGVGDELDVGEDEDETDKPDGRQQDPGWQAAILEIFMSLKKCIFLLFITINCFLTINY